MTLLMQMGAMHWLILGALLLILELLGAAGYLLWLGLAGLCIAALSALLPLDWSSQWLGFALLAVLFSAGWWWHLRRRAHQPDVATGLHHRLQHYIGQQSVLAEAELGGQSKVRLGDTMWTVRCPAGLPAGTAVRITGVDGMQLIAEPLNTPRPGH